MAILFSKNKKKLTLLFILLLSFYSLPTFADTPINTKKDLKKFTVKNQLENKKNSDTDEDEDNKPFTFNFDLDLGRFVWKGISLSRGLVLTPSTSISLFNFELNSNAYFYLNNEPFSGSLNFAQAQYKFPEVDVNLGYKNLEFWNLSVKPSTEFYFYPLGSDPVTGVVSLEFAYPLWMVKLISSHSVIFMGFPGVYYGDIGVSYENIFWDNFVLSSAIKVDITSNEFNNRFLGINKTSISAFESELSVAYNFNNFYIKPHIEFSSIIDGDLRKIPTFTSRNPNGTNNMNSNQPNSSGITQTTPSTTIVTPTIPNTTATIPTPSPSTRPNVGNNQRPNNFVRRLTEFDIVNFGISIGYDY